MAEGFEDREKIELFIACKNLKDADLFSKSDPQCFLSLKQQNQTRIIGQTEQIKDNLSPEFKKTIIADYIFEIKQHLTIEVRDDDGNSHDKLGVAETTIGELMGARNQVLILDLKLPGQKPKGKVIIRADKIKESNQNIWWHWNAQKLTNTDGVFFGLLGSKTDPFLRFFRKGQGNIWLLAHETEWIQDNLNPVWKPFEIKTSKIAPELDDEFKIECWDHQDNGQHQYVGYCYGSPRKIFEQQQKVFNLVNDKKQNKPAGTLNLQQVNMINKPSFVDFIRGGEQLNVIVAIDFTGSNGDPSNPTSLHSIKQDGSLNQYQNAILSTCEILLNYDYDKKVPAWGFGAKTPMDPSKANHCFNLSTDPTNPEVFGLPGILQAYQNAIFNCKFSGPTYFQYILQSAMAVAQQNEPNNVYTILLILTDGEIHDKDKVLQLLTQSALLPLSVIIVGVGNENFKTMQFLDGDDELKQHAQGKNVRDLVQFVAYNQFKNDPSLLAQHLLEELPEQLVTYKKMVGKQPNPPIEIQMAQLMQTQAQAVQAQVQVIQPQEQNQPPLNTN